LFRRSKPDTDTVTSSDDEGVDRTQTPGKGRPTPTRKEAEAAARARAKVARTRKEQAAQQRLARSESSRKVREAMKSGDERYFLPRDKGPVRRFVRDFVDSRFSFIELMIPLLVISMVLGYSGQPRLQGISSVLTFGTMLFILVDMLVLRFRLRRELTRRFPGDSLKGTTYYALTRALQMKFMRMPKARVKIGEKLPETYR
jgi:hypothetical protein